MRLRQAHIILLGVALAATTAGGLAARHRWKLYRRAAERCGAEAAELLEQADVWESLANNERKALAAIEEQFKGMTDDLGQAAASIFRDERIDGETAVRASIEAVVGQEARDLEKLLKASANADIREPEPGESDPQRQAMKAEGDRVLELVPRTAHEVIENLERGLEESLIDARRGILSYSQTTRGSLLRDQKRAAERRRRAAELTERRKALLRRWW